MEKESALKDLNIQLACRIRTARCIHAVMSFLTRDFKQFKRFCKNHRRDFKQHRYFVVSLLRGDVLAVAAA